MPQFLPRIARYPRPRHSAVQSTSPVPLQTPLPNRCANPQFLSRRQAKPIKEPASRYGLVHRAVYSIPRRADVLLLLGFPPPRNRANLFQSQRQRKLFPRRYNHIQPSLPCTPPTMRYSQIRKVARHLSCRDARVPAGTNRQLWCFLRLRESASAEERGLAAPNRNGDERDRKESIPSRGCRPFSQSVRLKDPGHVAVSPPRGGARRLLPDTLSRTGVYRCWQSWRPVGCPVNRRPTRDDDDNVEVEHVLDPVRPRAQP